MGMRSIRFSVCVSCVMAYRDSVVGAAFVTVAPSRWSATWNASARVALVMMSLRLTPRWTIVWAICGRMPLIMQSAPMRRVAATVFMRCCATSVSTVGTPVMSMIAHLAPVSQTLHDDLRPRAVECADQGKRQHLVPQLDDGRGQLHELLLLPVDHSLTALPIHFDRIQAQLVQKYCEVPQDFGQPLAVVRDPLLRQIEQRLLEREHECSCFRGTESLHRPLLRNLAEIVLYHLPMGRRGVIACGKSFSKQYQKLSGGLPQFGFLHQIPPQRQRGNFIRHP